MKWGSKSCGYLGKEYFRYGEQKVWRLILKHTDEFKETLEAGVGVIEWIRGRAVENKGDMIEKSQI